MTSPHLLRCSSGKVKFFKLYCIIWLLFHMYIIYLEPKIFIWMNVSKLFLEIRPSLSLWNLAQPLIWCFTWTTCVCSFSLPVASALSLQHNYSGWKATQKLLCQIAWNKTLNLRNCAKITCHPYMQYFQTLQTFFFNLHT